MGFYLGYLEVAGLMEKTSGLSCGVVVVERDFSCERLIADRADSVLGVIEELPDVFFGLVVHEVASNLFSNESLKNVYAVNNIQIASSITINDRNGLPSSKLPMLSKTANINAIKNNIVRIVLLVI